MNRGTRDTPPSAAPDNPNERFGTPRGSVTGHRVDQPDAIIERGPVDNYIGLINSRNMGLDMQLRQRHVVDPAASYPLATLNQTLLLELSDTYGQEGYDWQNPYAWAALGVLAYPNDNSSELVPAYGVNKAADSNDIALNVRATAGMLQVGGFGT